MINLVLFEYILGCETRAQCFSCGAKRLWQEGDNPFDEHLHDDCQHLKHIKEKQVCNLHEINCFQNLSLKSLSQLKHTW